MTTTPRPVRGGYHVFRTRWLLSTSRRDVQHELAALLHLALPVMSSRAGLLVMTTVDTVMTGWAGGAELAYLALGLAPFIFLMLVGTGLLTGTVVLVAQTHGAGEASACGRIWHLAMINAALAGVLSIAMLGHAEWFLDAFGQTPTMAAHGAEVASMFGLGMPAMLGFVATTLFLEGLGRPQIGVVVIMVGNLLNLPLNWLFIHGAFDWPPTGAAGAALATSVVRWLMLLAIVGYALLAPGVRACGSVGGPWPTWRLQVRLLRLGIPFAVSQGLETSAFQSLTLFCGWLGETQLAAYQIAINVTAMVYMATVGLATATAIRVGRGVGGGEPGKAITAAWLGVGATLLVMLLLAPAVAGGAPWLAAMFTTDMDVRVVATRCLVLVAAIIVADGLQGVLSGALRGAADVWVPMAIHVASFWLVLVPAAWLLGFSAKLGIDGLLWGILLGLSVAATLLVWRLVLLPPHRLQRA